MTATPITPHTPCDAIVPVRGEEDDETTIRITPDVLRGWLRRARRKYREGVFVLKMSSQGKLVRRTIFVDAKPEYFEITSAKLFDLGYHMSDIDAVVVGCDSPDFDAFAKQNPQRLPNPDKSCVVHVESRTISIVFKTESDRRDFVFLVRVQMRALQSKYSSAAAPKALSN